MVYLEHTIADRFWRCYQSSTKTVTTNHGKIGTEGLTITKSNFKNIGEVDEYVKKQTTGKIKQGYTIVEDPQIREDVKSKKKPARKRKVDEEEEDEEDEDIAKTTTTTIVGLKGFSAPDLDDSESSFFVDPGLAKIDSALASKVQVHKEFHAKLVRISKIIDNYYILQVLVEDGETSTSKTKRQKSPKKKQKKESSKQYHLFSRWGRTGTSGQARLEGPWDNEDDAKGQFNEIFEGKTGLDWSDAVPGASPKKGKYEFLDTSRKTKEDDEGEWSYYLSDDSFGKADGWYPYDDNNNQEMEKLYDDYVSSGKAKRLSSRLVYSESSGFFYRVDLAKLTQTNTESKKTRPIRRSV